jgi:8-oxo-dGTP pyrophosphatase MutT (NUDIX family)
VTAPAPVPSGRVAAPLPRPAPAPTRVPLRDAATVILVRDAPDVAGIEVFMLRRNLRSDFVGGAWVFPGGGVDDHDRHGDLGAVCRGRSDADASRQLGAPGGGLAFWVAAIRESFEEAGILLARDSRGRMVDFSDPAVDDRFRAHRRAVDRGERRLVDVCHEEGLELAVDALAYFAHWITPEGAVRRYDTRFFVAAPPAGQVPLHDDREVVAHCWIRPSEALARHRAGHFDLIMPTLRTLMTLERFESAAAVLDAATAVERAAGRAGQPGVPTVLPKVVEHGAGYRILLPGDPGYTDAISAALPEGLPMSALLGPPPGGTDGA